MSRILRFPPRPATPRACAGCFEPMPRTAPSYWRYCSRCYSFSSFRRVVDQFRKVKP